MTERNRLFLRRALALIAALALAAWAWSRIAAPSGPEGVISANGRTEAVEIDIAARTAGRIEAILADEGDAVEAGAVLVRMDESTLRAELDQAEASLAQAQVGVDAARSAVAQAEAEREAAVAVVAQRQASLDVAKKQYDRAGALAARGSGSESAKDDAEGAFLGAQAALAASKASRAAADAGVETAKAQVISAEAGVKAAEATVTRIRADLADGVLKAPRGGRIQYRVAQPGEVVAAGAAILNLVDLSDMHLTFFLPTAQAGLRRLGEDARITIDAAPGYVIPATISYVADVAQFTPRSVETAEERAKLMFRLKAQIDPALLSKYLSRAKTGVPGVVWLREDPNGAWPDELAISTPNPDAQ